jgi:hypothetical protein
MSRVRYLTSPLARWLDLQKIHHVTATQPAHWRVDWYVATSYNIRPIVACAYRGVFIEPLPSSVLSKSIIICFPQCHEHHHALFFVSSWCSVSLLVFIYLLEPFLSSGAVQMCWPCGVCGWWVELVDWNNSENKLVECDGEATAAQSSHSSTHAAL